MEQYGNEHFNLERVLRENIVGHEYMRRTAREMSAWDEVVDEIYRTVDHVEPWMSGNVRGPSTAFCLLYRLFELKLSEDQIQETLTCKDSPYIRAIGFLYLRYVCPPKDLISWVAPFFKDSEVFWPSGERSGQQVTMGAYVRDLLLCQNYFETIFNRIPKKISDEIVAGLREMGLATAAVGNGGQGGPDRRGGDDGRARPASVKASLSVAMSQRAPNRAGVYEDASQRMSRREDMQPPSGRGDAHERDAADRRDGAYRGGERHGHGRSWHDAPDGRHREAVRPRAPEAPQYRDRSRGNGEDLRHGERVERGARNQGRSTRPAPTRDACRDRPGGAYRDRTRHRSAREDGGEGVKDRSVNDRVFGRSADDVFGGARGSQSMNAPADVDVAFSAGQVDSVVKIGRRR